ncbi:hypothetical protein N7508_001639 [Penicillium antarcticum]|uniref:uncharacterized protein n=1 Tax=Penicillium antarcticum TaxID=416450 RepID=UPI00239AF324|nr:uncharacterized protein N7508_001639 [Penicillium antarcticum]KAJ5317131.1 hypothetical protein N7508_001639 [Penicillium antarcticum]
MRLDKPDLGLRSEWRRNDSTVFRDVRSLAPRLRLTGRVESDTIEGGCRDCCRILCVELVDVDHCGYGDIVALARSGECCGCGAEYLTRIQKSDPMQDQGHGAL